MDGVSGVAFLGNAVLVSAGSDGVLHCVPLGAKADTSRVVLPHADTPLRRDSEPRGEPKEADSFATIKARRLQVRPFPPSASLHPTPPSSGPIHSEPRGEPKEADSFATIKARRLQVRPFPPSASLHPTPPSSGPIHSEPRGEPKEADSFAHHQAHTGTGGPSQALGRVRHWRGEFGANSFGSPGPPPGRSPLKTIAVAPSLLFAKSTSARASTSCPVLPPRERPMRGDPFRSPHPPHTAMRHA
jgi:hypothetical protein